MQAEGWLYWMTVALSAAAGALVVAYIILVQDNRTVQAEVNAAAAVSNKDDKLRDLLADNGITINASGEPVPLASGPAEKTAPAATGKTP
jgi:hypothetical protein